MYVFISEVASFFNKIMLRKKGLINEVRIGVSVKIRKLSIVKKIYYLIVKPAHLDGDSTNST
jgi:hypothetical protein